MPTATTAPLLVLTILLWYVTRGNLLAIVLFTSIFDAASAMNLGGLGISPPLFSLVVCLAVKLVQGHQTLRFVSGLNRTALYLLLLFTSYSILTGLFYPFVFEGVSVTHSTTVGPLTWSVSNLAQICYLLASVLLYCLAVSSSRIVLQNAINWYIRGCFLSSLIGVYQLLNATVHLPYPDSILYSSPGHVVYRAYQINGMWRLNSTFTEASQFAIFTSVALGLLGWRLFTEPPTIRRGLALVLMVGMLIMTESSLGYIGLIFATTFGAVIYISYTIKRRGLLRGHLALAVILCIVSTIGLVLKQSIGQAAIKLVRSTLIDKQTSDSYRERTETHTAALNTLSSTYYLGAGWGSVRASGLAFILLGNVGVFGILLFTAFCLSLVLPLLQKDRRAVGSRVYGLYEQSLFAVAIMLVGLVVAGAEPVQPILWVLFGVATVGRPPVQRVDSRLIISRVNMITSRKTLYPSANYYEQLSFEDL